MTAIDAEKAVRYWLDGAIYDLDRLAEFMEFHTEARYPDVKMDFYLRCTPLYAREKYREIKKVFLWCQKMLAT
jgi:hypothetical protein